jgi:hypothetical protein
MTPQRILMFNAVSTAASALAMLAARGLLAPLFGLDSPALLDVIAAALLGYAALLYAAARRERVSRATLMAFTAADGLWVVGSAAILLLFWSQLAPVARVLVVAAALVVEVLATLQFRAARAAEAGSWQPAAGRRISESAAGGPR